MQITATFSDGSTQDVTNECDISPTQFTSYGQQQITITYEDQTTTTNVTVYGLQSITVTGDPTRKEYTTGETFDTAGIVLTATYTDGSQTKDEPDIRTNITASSEPFQTPNDSTEVTITYTNDYGQTAYTTVSVKVSPVGIESDDNYEIPAGVVASLEASFRNQVEQKATDDGYTLDDTLIDPAIQIKVNKAMEEFADTNFDPLSNYKTYLRKYGILVLDLTNEFRDTSKLDQVEKYYYAGGYQTERRATDTSEIWTSILPSNITSQLNNLSVECISDEDDPYATNTYRYYINLSASVQDNILKVRMAIIVERIRTPKA